MSRPGRSPANRFWIFLAALAMAGACSSAGSSCAGLAPLPGGARFPEAQKTDNIANLRLTQDGIDFLNTNWRPLLRGMLPDAGVTGDPTIRIPIACKQISGASFADQGTPGCNSTACGRLNGTCDLNPNSPTWDAPAVVTASISDFQVVPTSPDLLQVTLGLKIDTGALYVGYSCVQCSVRFNNTNVGAGKNVLDLTVKFSVDPKWSHLIDLTVTELNGTQICGSSGAPAAPECLNANALHVDSISGSFCDSICNLADSSFTQDILSFLSPYIQDVMLSMVNNQFCEPCGALGQATCPTGSTCSSGTCTDNQNPEACVPRLLGIEGRATLASFVQSFGVPPDAQMDLSIGLGSSANVNAGLNLGMRGGVLASARNACVPSLPTPSVPTVPVPQFDAEAPPGASGYHMALGLSQPFLSQALFQAQQSGALCLNMTTASLGMLNTGLIKTFLPSLGQLATRDGLDAPMQISLRPGAPPSIDVGAGTVDPVSGKALAPLITLKMPKLSIDFYAQIDDRLARLFTLTADVSMPLSMSITGCSGLSPAFGDLQQVITNVSVTNSELLAEDPTLLGDLVPLAMGMAQPAIASLIKPISLPNFGNFKLQLNAATGINPIPSQAGNFYHLAVYGTLLPVAATCTTVAPLLSASLARAEIPPASEMTLTGKGLPLPTAVLAVRGEGSGATEYSYRVDDGFWSEFHPSTDGRLRVSRASFLLQGTHQIDVRARFAGDPGSVSPAVRVPFLVDWDPPELSLVRTADQGLEVKARDVISGTALRYAYKLGDGAWSGYGPAHPIEREALRQAGGVSVRVQDESGNVAERSWKGLTTLSRVAPAATAAGQAQGCTAPGLPGGLVSLLAMAGWCGLRRRRAGR